jgi:hypothetical protein
MTSEKTELASPSQIVRQAVFRIESSAREPLEHAGAAAQPRIVGNSSVLKDTHFSCQQFALPQP